jgi:putative effector of murein hydrolase LrgA (UPF0299 family)
MIALFRLGQWVERKLALPMPGLVVSLWLFNALYFSILWTCQELSNTHR